MASPSILARLGLDLSGFNGNVREAERGTQRLNSSFSSLSTSFGALGAGIGAIGVASFAKDCVEAAAKIESLGAAFEVLVGDAATGQEVLKGVMDFANQTPYAVEDLASATKSLLAFNFGAGEVMDTLRRLGDIASGIGAPIGEIAEIYGKARVQGRLFAEDMNQLTGRGIPVIQEFAKQLNTTDDRVKALVENGKIGFPELERAIVSLTSEGGKFSGMMAKQAETTSGKIGAMADQWEAFKRALADTNAAKKGIDVVTASLKKMEELVTGNEDGASTFLGRLMEHVMVFDSPGMDDPHEKVVFASKKREAAERVERAKKQREEQRAKDADMAAKRKRDEEIAEMDEIGQEVERLHIEGTKEQTEQRQAADKKRVEDAQKLLKETEKLQQAAYEEAKVRMLNLSLQQMETAALEAERDGHADVAEELRTKASFASQIVQAYQNGDTAAANELEKQQGITLELQKQKRAKEQQEKEREKKIDDKLASPDERRAAARAKGERDRAGRAVDTIAAEADRTKRKNEEVKAPDIWNKADPRIRNPDEVIGPLLPADFKARGGGAAGGAQAEAPGAPGGGKTINDLYTIMSEIKTTITNIEIVNSKN